MSDTNPIAAPLSCTCGLPPGHEPIGQFHRDGRPRGSTEPVHGRCGAHLRKSCPHRYCLNRKLLDPRTGRCTLHNGRPMEHGRRSRAQPKALKAYYDEATSPEVLAITDEIRTTDAIITHLVDSLRTGEGSVNWMALQAALVNGDPSIPAEVISAALDNHKANMATLKRLAESMQSKAKLLDCQTRQLAQAQQHVTPADLGRIVVFLLETVAHCVKDRAILQEIRTRVHAHPMIAGPPKD